MSNADVSTIKSVIALLDSMTKCGEKPSKKSMTALTEAREALKRIEGCEGFTTAVVIVTCDAGLQGPAARHVKLCSHEDQGFHEIERQVMNIMSPSECSYNVRRGDKWVTIQSHGKNGEVTKIYYLTIESVTKSTAPGGA